MEDGSLDYKKESTLDPSEFINYYSSSLNQVIIDRISVFKEQELTVDKSVFYPIIDVNNNRLKDSPFKMRLTDDLKNRIWKVYM